jgi:NAD(P)-dependent dehydrogenase (short-subunit alcohol dehydrogenase family)
MDAHSGKTAIVTDSDIGRASAEALARAGFTVFGTSRRTTAEGTSQVSMLRSEVTDDAAVNAVVSTVLSKTGRIDVLVNNAGIWAAGGRGGFLGCPGSSPYSTSICSESCG